jgi:integrase
MNTDKALSDVLFGAMEQETEREQRVPSTAHEPREPESQASTKRVATAEKVKPKRTRRPRGSIFTRQDSPYIWIAYSCNRRKIRVNTKQTDRRKAHKLLDKRLAEITTGVVSSVDVNKTSIPELAEDFLRDYKINGLKSLDDAERRWKLHLKPFFGTFKATQVSPELIARFIDARQHAGAKNGSINRELSALKRMYSLGIDAGKVLRMPRIAMLKESNIRKGFLEAEQRDRLAAECAKVGLWLRSMFEVACLCGWRVSELLNLRVRQVDLRRRTLLLNPGETKNDAARIVFMTDLALALVSECVCDKCPDDFVFTRGNGKRVADFRCTWRAACCRAGVGRMVCPDCKDSDGKATFAVDANRRCPHCSIQWRPGDLAYHGLIFHDLRRSAVRSMVRSGIPERVAMTISGHKTRSVFDRYNIVSETDLREAASKMNRETPAVPELGPDSVTAMPSPSIRTVN